jgi:hypothetical protein
MRPTLIIRMETRRVQTDQLVYLRVLLRLVTAAAIAGRSLRA